jgi:DNA mismatch endonuclease, patch repair protein
MDRISQAQRSANMRNIKGKNTSPELQVRRMLYRLGFRYRLHDRRLPGKPDLIFRRRRKVIFVHGCFWHQHEECLAGKIPRSNVDYWQPKLNRNVERDRDTANALRAAGWEVLIIWECEARIPEKLRLSLEAFLA